MHPSAGIASTLGPALFTSRLFAHVDAAEQSIGDKVRHLGGTVVHSRAVGTSAAASFTGAGRNVGAALDVGVARALELGGIQEAGGL